MKALILLQALLLSQAALAGNGVERTDSPTDEVLAIAQSEIANRCNLPGLTSITVLNYKLVVGSCEQYECDKHHNLQVRAQTARNEAVDFSLEISEWMLNAQYPAEVSINSRQVHCN